MPEQSFRRYNFLGQYLSPGSGGHENVTGTAKLILGTLKSL